RDGSVTAHAVSMGAEVWRYRLPKKVVAGLPWDADWVFLKGKEVVRLSQGDKLCWRTPVKEVRWFNRGGLLGGRKEVLLPSQGKQAKQQNAVYPEPQGKQSKKMLTGEQARKALFKMVLSLRRNKLLQDEVKVLTSQPIKNVHKTIIRIGRWYCDLRQLSFSIGF